MKTNMNGWERAARAVGGVGLIAWAVAGTQPLHWLGWFGAVPLATALVGFCPLYALLGVSTCRKRSMATGRRR